MYDKMVRNTYSGGITVIHTNKWLINLAFLLAVSACHAAPVISIPQPNSDAGDTNQGDPINFSVEIYNKGNQTLKLTAATGCKCGTVDLEPEVAPNSMVLLKYLVQTNDMQGKNTRTVQIQTNDPKRPKITLPFRMNVKAPYWLEPTGTTVINLAAGAIAKRTFTVKSSSQAPVVLSEPSGLPQYCTAKVQGCNIIVSVTPYAPYGKSSFSLSVPVIKPNRSSVSAVVVINKGIVSEPASVYLGSYSSSMAKPMRASIVLNSVNHFKITAVKSPPGLAVALKRTHANNWFVEVTLTKPIAKGVYRSVVVLSTDQPGQNRLEIPVVAMRN